MMAVKTTLKDLKVILAKFSEQFSGCVKAYYKQPEEKKIGFLKDIAVEVMSKVPERLLKDGVVKDNSIQVNFIGRLCFAAMDEFFNAAKTGNLISEGATSFLLGIAHSSFFIPDADNDDDWSSLDGAYYTMNMVGMSNAYEDGNWIGRAVSQIVHDVLKDYILQFKEGENKKLPEN